jgi:hypothetical protein
MYVNKHCVFYCSKSKTIHGGTPVQIIMYISITKGLRTLIKHSSMNKSCVKKLQHRVKIFYMWMFCITLKERNTKRFVQNWHSPSHLRQNGHYFV